MKKVLLVIAIALGTVTHINAQDSIVGLRIMNPVPIDNDLNMHDSIEVTAFEAWTGENGNIVISYRTMLKDSTPCVVPYIKGKVSLSDIPYDWTPAYLILKGYFESKALTIEELK